MKTHGNHPDESGLVVIDFEGDLEFAERPPRARDMFAQLEAMQRLTRSFVERPELMLQELVDAAVELCGADSAVISVRRPERGEQAPYHWTATAGVYAGFLDVSWPSHPSACGVCLERGRPQHFRADERYFEIHGVDAPVVTDGILLPWSAGSLRGTIFVMTHDRAHAFDRDDVRIMKMLADFVTMAIRHEIQQQAMVQQAANEAATAMAQELAHQINNPLQSLTNGVYLTQAGKTSKQVAAGMQQDVVRLAELVREILRLPAQRLN